MRRADFHLVRGSFDEAMLHACRICAKAFDHGFQAACLTASAAQSEQLDELLWRFDGQRFIGHYLWPEHDWSSGAAVLISHQGLPPAAANSLLLDLTGSGIEASGYTRLADVFIDQPESRQAARDRYRSLQRQGLELHFHSIDVRPPADS